MRRTLHEEARLLVVDRTPAQGQIVRSQLKYLGFRQIELVCDTGDALAHLAGAQFHAVLCDIDVGPMSGPEFTIEARSRAGLIDPYAMLIMLSYAPTWRKITACRDAGANHFLARPVSGLQLNEKLISGFMEARRFIKARSYFGPDRRRGSRSAYGGPDRRRTSAVSREAIPSLRLIA